ncbi:3'-5' exonuclease [Geobacter sp. OR-1]|uniref:3'-5' exonuclease n=1 Tax=Geobacter sp. OR-1 TaxID=1266765 RepID=UPI000B2BEEC0|nr:3'-5' exonuclease [Geobacter sp. OR-1]
MKPTFQAEWLALPPKISHQVLEKLSLLTQDPRPDGVGRKKLKDFGGKLHRMRCGDYRIFYTFEEPYVSLLALRKRHEHTYDEDIEAESLGGLIIDTPVVEQQKSVGWESFLKPVNPQTTQLPEPITAELLSRLRIPDHFHNRLTLIQTREALYECPGVPEEHLLMLDEVMFERSFEEIIQQPDFLANDVSDLLKFKEGSLLSFLLKLDPEQEKFVYWAMDSKGPTMVKGGPGTGKSTVALYRVRTLMEAIRSDTPVRVLFTTYTNALVSYSRQLLSQLLGSKVASVEVRTADSLVHAIVKGKSGEVNILPPDQEKTIFQQAIDKTDFGGGSLARRSHMDLITRLGIEYLMEEIAEVIEARGLTTVDDYQSCPRGGRRIPLNANQRSTVWQVRESFIRCMARANATTWAMLRHQAAQLVKEGHGPKLYDAVIVDEAQDLDPVSLGMLANLCKNPNRLFVTADANQSIYKNGFSWSDVHDSLQFRGRTGVLKTNHRSTKEIGEAAKDYLGAEAIDEITPQERQYSHTGPLPAVRRVVNEEDEASLIARFFQGASKELRFGISACAVLVPTQRAGESLAAKLSSKGIDVEFMSGKTLDLEKPVAKIITLKSSKGLEFPVVALSGFSQSIYPKIVDTLAGDVSAERTSRERRTLYVAMTRAMRALLILLPLGRQDSLFEGFDGSLWNIGD